jgi:uncharacterized membrane protein
MRLGTYWLVRVGIVMVLTGLVFFGHLAYENYIRQLGAGGKVCLLYSASAVLLVAGGWWQRRASRTDLKNYGQVLFAGGLAALYFTTYAAHHIGPLRVIPSALVDGLLLLVCAGLVVAAAQHWKSEVLGVFAIGLAFYTAVITQAGFFTLYSNLVLTAAAVLFLVRNRWATLSFAGLVASYAAYGFWRFLGPDGWHASEQVWPGICFLAAYWTIFSAGVFLSRDGGLAGPRRATFLTLNNNAFLLMFFLTMLQARQDWFWAFALVYGAVLLALAAGARQVLPAEPLAWNSYLTEGLLLVTLGCISKFSGSALALLLAMESVVLLLSAHRISNTVLLVGAYASAGLAAGWSIDAMGLHAAADLYTGMGVGAFILANTILTHRHTPVRDTVPLRPGPAYFALLALAVWWVATYDNSSAVQLPVLLGLEALLLTFSCYVLSVGELTLFGQGYLVLGQALWLLQVWDAPAPAWWTGVALLLITFMLLVWWHAQRVLALPPEIRRFLQGLYTFALLGLALVWCNRYISAHEQIWSLSLLAALWFGLAGRRANRELLLFSAAFALNALALFWRGALQTPTVYWPDLVPTVVLLGAQQAAHRWPARYRLTRPLQMTLILTGGLSLWGFLTRWVLWLEDARGGSYLTASWSLLGLALFTIGFALRERGYRWLGLGVLAAALGRVLLFDVWKLETIYRILSFMALGIVLLVLGFIYNRYQERIRQWL